MAALTPTKVLVRSARVDKEYGSSVTKVQEVYIEATSTATSNTIDLDTYLAWDVNGILGCTMNSVDAANSSTYPTWSGSTVTLAQHAGSGGCKFMLLVY